MENKRYGGSAETREEALHGVLKEFEKDILKEHPVDRAFEIHEERYDIKDFKQYKTYCDGTTYIFKIDEIPLRVQEVAENRIIWEMHQKNYKTSIFIIITQVILLFIQIFIQYMLRDVKTGLNNLSLGSILSFVISIFSWILLAISMFNQHINSKAWREAVEKSDRLFRGEEK